MIDRRPEAEDMTRPDDDTLKTLLPLLRQLREINRRVLAAIRAEEGWSPSPADPA